MNRISIFLLLILILVRCNSANSEKQSTADTPGQEPRAKTVVLTAEEFADKLKAPNVQLVDVRTPGEVAGGKIANAVNIDYNSTSFEELAAKLDRNKPVAVYCKVGGRSSRAVQVFEELGFKEIYELEGGIISWKASKLPVEE